MSSIARKGRESSVVCLFFKMIFKFRITLKFVAKRIEDAMHGVFRYLYLSSMYISTKIIENSKSWELVVSTSGNICSDFELQNEEMKLDTCVLIYCGGQKVKPEKLSTMKLSNWIGHIHMHLQNYNKSADSPLSKL